METHISGRQRSFTYQPPQPADYDVNESKSVDSLEACLLRARNRNDSSDDRDAFEKMEKALRGVEEALQPGSPINRRSSPSSDDSLMSDGGKFMDMRSKSNPTPMSCHSVAAGSNKQLEVAKAYALCMGIEVEDALETLSRVDGDKDDDFVANLDVVASVQRKRSKEERQKSDSQTHASEDRQVVDREFTVLHPDDEMDASTSTGRSSYYSDSEEDDEDEVNVLGELWGLIDEQRKAWLGNVRDELRNQRIIRRRRARMRKIRRKRSARRRREGRNARDDATQEGTFATGHAYDEDTLEGTVSTSGYTGEDATIEGTIGSGYTREEDTTLAGTILSGSTRGGETATTTMSGSNTEYEMPVPVKKPSPLLEPNYLAEEDDDDGGENESIGNKVLSMIHINICSGTWFKCQSTQSEGEEATANKTNTNAKESNVGGMSVKERLDLLVQGLQLDSDVAAANVVKKNNNSSMESSPLVRTPTQKELKAIYYERRATEAKNSLQLTESPRPDADDDTVEMSNLNKVASTKTAAVAVDYQKKKSFRHKLFSSRSKKKGLSKGSSAAQSTSGMPVSPARTAATGTSDNTSLESQSRDEDDDVCASYAALAITRTDSKTLISI